MSNSLAEFGYDIGIEAQEGDHEGDLPSLVTIAWENTEDVKNLAGFFLTCQRRTCSLRISMHYTQSKYKKSLAI